MKIIVNSLKYKSELIIFVEKHIEIYEHVKYDGISMGIKIVIFYKIAVQDRGSFEEAFQMAF